MPVEVSNQSGPPTDRTTAVLRILSGHETVHGIAGKLQLQEEQVADWCRSFVRAGLYALRRPPQTVPTSQLRERQLQQEIDELQEALAEANTELALWEALQSVSKH